MQRDLHKFKTNTTTAAAAAATTTTPTTNNNNRRIKHEICEAGKPFRARYLD
jgi:hypothetical protein